MGTGTGKAWKTSRVAGLALVMLAAAGGCATTEDSTMAITSPAQLIGTEWWVEDIAGGGVIDNSRTTIGFPEDQRVAGSTGCNNYTGDIAIYADRMTFGVLAGTRRACVPALGNQEVKFYSTVDKVKSWMVTNGGQTLVLKDEAGDAVIRASRVKGSE